MLSLQAYLENPCGASSIPYWKTKRLNVPEHMKIVHERDFSGDMLSDYDDEPYFRLYHRLENIAQEARNDVEVVSGEACVPEYVRLIHESYDDIRVTVEQMESYQHTPVYNPDLWILLKERKTGAILAGGIADYDGEAGELALEWIQVLPRYRRHGYGQFIVNFLLSKMRGVARFATVSGKVNNPSNPEGLYRKCGFTGNDIWHVLSKK